LNKAPHALPIFRDKARAGGSRAGSYVERRLMQIVPGQTKRQITAARQIAVGSAGYRTPRRLPSTLPSPPSRGMPARQQGL